MSRFFGAASRIAISVMPICLGLIFVLQVFDDAASIVRICDARNFEAPSFPTALLKPPMSEMRAWVTCSHS